jgi:hypothetical protein
MNPSTADAKHDDPTVRWEMNYSQRELGCLRYVKVNVCDYRATNPRDLLVSPCPASPENAHAIIEWVRKADVVVCTWGRMPAMLQKHIDRVERILLNYKIAAWCLGSNLDGSPKHPLYLPQQGIELVRYTPAIGPGRPLVSCPKEGRGCPKGLKKRPLTVR